MFISLYQTPEVFWRNWINQKHIARYPGLYEEQSEMFDEFKEKNYMHNKYISELNQFIQRKISCIEMNIHFYNNIQ